MNYFFSKNKILSALCDFYAGTGIAVALYDSAGNTVAGTPIIFLTVGVMLLGATIGIFGRLLSRN